ncbi:Co2+/Mg2+ efflux protein ApaG [Aliiglaciecola sp. M165]|uniref:Co2+/Mg2+ efflux protein ApaG n=1 Tax=Aliiglaciecola sp. M165 TaxID=2593649 RepID=UPI00117DB50A|nr:Co2+/Mg2+ efflux protein ApaG [Aliiglaciecola sp. M165]TRY30595.1 Co2+/Mg2+ efflux protein ApaG [Aliiglaciecola sp. M165]
MAANDICIRVQTQFLEDQFNESDPKYAFAYRVTIINNGSVSAKLLRRYWLITDGNGEKTEVSGEGVVGEQPVIEPGKYYQYTSGAVLDTPVGTMQGHYEFVGGDESVFKAPIDVFRLAVNNMVN